MTIEPKVAYEGNTLELLVERLERSHMSAAKQHNEGRRPLARTHEAGKPVAGSHEAGKPRSANPHVRSAANTNSTANPRVRNGANSANPQKKTDPAQADSANKADSTNKELRRMSRSELIEVIYALEQDNQSLQKENEKLRAELDDKDIRIATSGSIAEAALSLNHIFEDAQAAADQYLDSIKRAATATTQRGRQIS